MKNFFVELKNKCGALTSAAKEKNMCSKCFKEKGLTALKVIAYVSTIGRFVIDLLISF